jgi:hypothetical protein
MAVVVCAECGKAFKGHYNKRGGGVTAWTALSGHIMASSDHIRKKWAKSFLLKANVGTGLWGDRGRLK